MYGVVFRSLADNRLDKASTMNGFAATVPLGVAYPSLHQIYKARVAPIHLGPPVMAAMPGFAFTAFLDPESAAAVDLYGRLQTQQHHDSLYVNIKDLLPILSKLNPTDLTRVLTRLTVRFDVSIWRNRADITLVQEALTTLVNLTELTIIGLSNDDACILADCRSSLDCFCTDLCWRSTSVFTFLRKQRQLRELQFLPNAWPRLAPGTDDKKDIFTLPETFLGTLTTLHCSGECFAHFAKFRPGGPPDIVNLRVDFSTSSATRKATLHRLVFLRKTLVSLSLRLPDPNNLTAAYIVDGFTGSMRWMQLRFLEIRGTIYTRVRRPSTCNSEPRSLSFTGL